MHESVQLPNLVFSDVKPFQIEQCVNTQNDQVYLPKKSAENVYLGLAIRTLAQPMVMVWAAVSADGRFPLVFIKVNAEYYRENVLKAVLKP